MLLQRTRLWLIMLAALFAAAANARAQFPPFREEPPPASEPTHPQELQPFGPVDLGDIKDAQIWAPVEFNDQDRFPQGAYGPYFRYERFYYSIHQPGFAQIGSNVPEIVALGLNESTSGFIKAGFVWGNRFDLGYRQCDNYGWDVSIIKSNLDFGGGAIDVPGRTSVGFFDPTGVLPLNALEALVGIDETGVPFPPLFAFDFIPYSPLKLQNTSRFTGVELMKTYRYPPGHHGGVWEIGAGPRFFQFHDRFDATGTTIDQTALFADGTIILPQTPPNIVSIARTLDAPPAQNFWDLGIDNNLVGPELAARWEIERGRWTVSTDFRAMFAANFQTAHLAGATSAGWTSHIIRLDTGATIPGTTIGNGVLGQPLFTFNNSQNNITFAPLGELRLDAIYKLTRNASIEVGYTGLLMSGIGRAVDRIIYNVPNMEILNGADKQHVFINGVNMGFNINY
jgi:Putative beta barrel porin-7 (BBP7)